MPFPTSVSTFIQTVQQAWGEWRALTEPIERDEMLKPSVDGEWSLKDMIAHVTWYEREMVEVIKAHDLVGSDLWDLPAVERNATIHEQVKDLPLDQVLEEAEAVHQELVALLPRLSDEDLVNPGGFPNMPPDWQPGDILAQNTYEHYEQHMPDVKG